MARPGNLSTFSGSGVLSDEDTWKDRNRQLPTCMYHNRWPMAANLILNVRTHARGEVRTIEPQGTGLSRTEYPTTAPSINHLCTGSSNAPRNKLTYNKTPNALSALFNYVRENYCCRVQGKIKYAPFPGIDHRIRIRAKQHDLELTFLRNNRL